jgi:hypothetical protein
VTSPDHPRRPHPARALTDHDSAQVLTEATQQLMMLRSPMYHDDALAELHALASLTLEANRRLPQVVTDARDQQHSWSEIAGQTRPASPRRHGPPGWPHNQKEDATRPRLKPTRRGRRELPTPPAIGGISRHYLTRWAA